MIARHARELEPGDLILVPYRRPRWRRVLDVFPENGTIRLDLSDGGRWHPLAFEPVRCTL